jgi:hypothetical protein
MLAPEGDPLMKSATSLGEIHLTPDGDEKAEFRIEGMTCGACVEVYSIKFVDGDLLMGGIEHRVDDEEPGGDSFNKGSLVG